MYCFPLDFPRHPQFSSSSRARRVEERRVERVLVDKLDTTIEAHNRIPVDIQSSCVYQRAQQSVGIACDTQRGDLKENGIVLAAREPQGSGEVDQEKRDARREQDRRAMPCSVFCDSEEKQITHELPL